MNKEKIDVYICKYYSVKHGRKNGRACLLNPDAPKRCMPFYYETNCENYEEEDLDKIIEEIDENI